MRKLLKILQVAEILNISRGKAYQIVNKGVLTPINVDGCIRVAEEELIDMIEKQFNH